MRSILRFEAFDGKIFATAEECMIYEKEFKKNTYEATLRASLVFRVDGLELPVRVKCSNHLVQNDPYGVELASLAEENLYETYEAKDLAHEDFIQDMHRPIANTNYDEIIVEDENNKEVARY